MSTDRTLEALRPSIAFQRPRTLKRGSMAFLSLAHYIYHQHVHGELSYRALAESMGRSASYPRGLTTCMKRHADQGTMRPTTQPDLALCGNCHGIGEAGYVAPTNCGISNYIGVCHLCYGMGFTATYRTSPPHAARAVTLHRIIHANGTHASTDLLLWALGLADKRALYAFTSRLKDTEPAAKEIFDRLPRPSYLDALPPMVRKPRRTAT